MVALEGSYHALLNSAILLHVLAVVKFYAGMNVTPQCLFFIESSICEALKVLFYPEV